MSLATFNLQIQAFKHVLDLTYKGELKRLGNLILSNDFKILEICFSNGNRNVRNVIPIALKWLLFDKKRKKFSATRRYAPRHGLGL